MPALNDAIEDLKTQLVDARDCNVDYHDRILKAVALFWNVHPDLLTRMFKVKTGVDPKDYKIADPIKLQQKIDQAERRILEANNFAESVILEFFSRRV